METAGENCSVGDRTHYYLRGDLLFVAVPGSDTKNDRGCQYASFKFYKNSLAARAIVLYKIFIFSEAKLYGQFANIVSVKRSDYYQSRFILNLLYDGNHEAYFAIYCDQRRWGRI